MVPHYGEWSGQVLLWWVSSFLENMESFLILFKLYLVWSCHKGRQSHKTIMRFLFYSIFILFFMISICLEHKVVLKIQSKKVKLNDWKFKSGQQKYLNWMTWSTTSLPMQNNLYYLIRIMGLLVFSFSFFCVENFGYFVERNFEGKNFETKK